MEEPSYFIEKLSIDRYDLSHKLSNKSEVIDIWRQTERGKFLSKYQISEITEYQDAATYTTVLVIKFAMSPQQVTFFNLKFGK